MNSTDDFEEARELYNRYARNWDDNRPDDVAACFTPDAAFITQQGPLKGREGVITAVNGLNAAVTGRRQFHITTNVSVQLAGDCGTGTAYFTWVVSPKDGPATVAYGTYHDELRKLGGRWYFSTRTATVEGGELPSMPQ